MFDHGDITGELYEEFKNLKTKIGQKCWNILDHDLCSVIVTDTHWWVEKTSIYNVIPNYFMNFLDKYLKRTRNLEPLWDI